MTIEKRFTIDDNIELLCKAFPEYCICKGHYNCSYDIHFYEKGWFGSLIAKLNRTNLSCICNNEELALTLDAKYPKLKITLYTELVDL